MNEMTPQRQRQSELPVSLPPRGLSRLQVAEYVGVSASTLDKMVTDGEMPAPKRIRGRVIWDLKEVDRAFEALSEGDVNPWD